MATPVIMPKQGNSVESCIIVQWMKDVGETVAAGDALCEIETDKATFEVEAPAAGVLVARFFEADDDVPVLINIAVIGDAGEDVSALKPSEAAESATDTAAPATEKTSEPVSDYSSTETKLAPAISVPASSSCGSSPRARKTAQVKAVDIQTVAGTGPHGRVIERDVIAAAAAGPRVSPAAQDAIASGAGVAPACGSGLGGMVLSTDIHPAALAEAAASAPEYEDIAVRGIRKVIAERMQASLSQSAQLTLQASFKAAALQKYRAQGKSNAEQMGLPNITINDMIVFAVSRVLQRHPQLNAHFLGSSIRQFRDVHIGIAVDTERGLLVPVLRHVNLRSLSSVSAAFKPLAISCQQGKASPDDLQGGTFTITNLGNMGIDHFTPVLNVPEVAILGVGGIQLKPYREADGSVDFADSIALSLTIDHQAVDGAPAARFLKDLVAALENFELILA
ncbi:MAG: 2-oxo acid dehydrogenase subunit E2 [Planctomycetes bacterium]|nr:2-oxo acid dehydrogenase subunit E2 [Planctomycetota bacterium]